MTATDGGTAAGDRSAWSTVTGTVDGSGAGRSRGRARAVTGLAAGIVVAVVLAVAIVLSVGGVTGGAETSPAPVGSGSAPGDELRSDGDASDRGTGPRADAGTPALSRPRHDLDATAPVSVTLPALGVEAAIIPLDLRDDGTIEVPPDHADAGWYRHGGRPGEPGATVLGAHVDWAGQPGVFRDLDRLRPGDLVEVTRRDGVGVTYRIDRLEQHPKDAFPTFEVYGPTSTNTLRLVTCGGPFLSERGQHRDNVIAFATAVDDGTERADDAAAGATHDGAGTGQTET